MVDDIKNSSTLAGHHNDVGGGRTISGEVKGKAAEIIFDREIAIGEKNVPNSKTEVITHPSFSLGIFVPG